MPTPALAPLEALAPARFETLAILKKLASSSRQLAELKGIAATIPNQGILINTVGLQEAKDSSEIENIVTTHDELFKEGGPRQLLRQPRVERGAAAAASTDRAGAVTEDQLEQEVDELRLTHP
jgi:Fic family protein